MAYLVPFPDYVVCWTFCCHLQLADGPKELFLKAWVLVKVCSCHTEHLARQVYSMLEVRSGLVHCC